MSDDNDPQFSWLKAVDYALEVSRSLPVSEDDIYQIKKAGMYMPMTWEGPLASDRTGRYEPAGVRWVQWIAWALGLALFKVWVGIEALLNNSRHFYGAGGYDCEEAWYREFSQKRKWVKNEE